MALKTKGRPAILLLEMLKLMSFSPTAVIMSERHVDEAALRDDAVDGWRFVNVIEHKIINCIVHISSTVGGCRKGKEMPSGKRNGRRNCKSGSQWRGARVISSKSAPQHPEEIGILTETLLRSIFSKLGKRLGMMRTSS